MRARPISSNGIASLALFFKRKSACEVYFQTSKSLLTLNTFWTVVVFCKQHSSGIGRCPNSSKPLSIRLGHKAASIRVQMQWDNEKIMRQPLFAQDSWISVHLKTCAPTKSHRDVALSHVCLQHYRANVF